MVFKKLLSYVLIGVTLFTVFPSDVFAAGGVISKYGNKFNNYKFINFEEGSYKMYSINNIDTNAFWRPKYDEVSEPIEESIEYYQDDVSIYFNAFDVGWNIVNKTSVPSSRALEVLGYDFLLYSESMDNGYIQRTLGYKTPITAPYFIMNIYKALGIELYDVYARVDQGEPPPGTMGVFITRTNPMSYWKLFLNDHPIDLSIYNDVNVNDISAGKVLTTAEAISILAQMLEFYGEPIISKQEEYMLLQVYGDDVPGSLSDNYKEAWSYLKCRGIIGEEEYDYSSNLTFEDMMELLMRASDKESRTNFKEIQIVTDIDSSFIENGFYDTEVKLTNQPAISPDSSQLDFSTSDRIDFLIEINDDIAFRFPSTGELNRNIFISKGPNYNDSPIPGSVFEGIVNGSYYHFSVPYSQIGGNQSLYLNSNKSGDYPLNYRLPNSNGGIYSTYNYNRESGYVTYSNSISFNEGYPDSFYVDKQRKGSGSRSRAAAASGTLRLNYTTELVDISKSREAITSIGGTLTSMSDTTFTVSIPLDNLQKLGISGNDYKKFISRTLVIKDEYRYESSAATKAILGLTGERLLVNLDEAKSIGLIDGYKALPDDKILIIYTCDGDVVIADDKAKTIQKGNTYLQIQEQQPLFITDEGSYCVDFRALFGTKEIGFKLDTSTGEPTVNFYSNKLEVTSSTDGSFGPNPVEPVYRMNDYVWDSTTQRYAYYGYNNGISGMNVDLLYKFGSRGGGIEKVLLPMSSSNPMGNYILYGKMNSNIGREEYHILRVTPTDTAPVHSGNDSTKTIESMFWYKPKNIPLDKYNISVVKLSADNTLGFEYVDGVGWCYNLKSTPRSNQGSVKSFMSSYRSSSAGSFLPFTYSSDSSGTSLLNYNLNFMSEEEMANVDIPSGGPYNSYTTAPIALQTWFTNSSLVPTLNINTIKSYAGNETGAPYLYWGSMECTINRDGKIITKLGGLDISGMLPESLRITGMNRIAKNYKGEDSYMSPGAYSITTEDFSTTINEVKEDERKLMSEKAIAAQEFFDKFKDITFMDLVHNLDNSMSIMYYIATRVVPLIILCLLVIMLLISMVSDIRIVVLFCDKVFDPVKILTFGNYNIHTMNNRFLILSLIGALTIMGIIQAGNLEKIIMWSIEWFYAIMGLFG